jgi:hypothetical protein
MQIDYDLLSRRISILAVNSDFEALKAAAEALRGPALPFARQRSEEHYDAVLAQLGAIAPRLSYYGRLPPARDGSVQVIAVLLSDRACAFILGIFHSFTVPSSSIFPLATLITDAGCDAARRLASHGRHDAERPW